MHFCSHVYAAAPEMKNHLSMLGSIGAGAMVSLWGMGGSWSGLTRLGDCLTVRLVLWNNQFEVCENARLEITYVEMSPGWDLPVMSFSQASAHSRTMSVAYLSIVNYKRHENKATKT